MSSDAPRTLTGPARLAAGIIAAALLILVVTLIATRLVRSPGGLIALAMARHAAEGALIGGICDFIAVANVYKKARESFLPLVRGVSETVVKDFVGVRRLLLDAPQAQETLLPQETLQQLQAMLSRAIAQLSKDEVRKQALHWWSSALRPGITDWLVDVDLRGELLGLGAGRGPGFVDAPECRAAIAACVDEVALDDVLAGEMVEAIQTFAAATPLTELGVKADPRVLEQLCQDFWQGKGRDRFVDWLADLDLRGQVQLGGAGPLSDRAVRTVIAECVRATAQDDHRLVRTVERLKPVIRDFAPVLGTIGASFLGPSNIRSAVHKVAATIETESSDARVSGLLGEYAAAYLDRWHRLSPEVRRGAAGRVADAVAPAVMSRAVATLAPWLEQLTLGDLTRHTLKTSTLQQGLRRAAVAIRAVEPRPTPGARTAWDGAVRYLGAYLNAWHRRSSSVRARAVGAALDPLAPRLIDKLIDVGWEHRDRLVDLPRLARSDAFRQLVTFVAQHAVQRADAVESKSIELLAQQLGSQGPEAFVAVLRQRTQTQLDWIKVNGTIWGAGLGLASGLITGLVEHL